MPKRKKFDWKSYIRDCVEDTRDIIIYNNEYSSQEFADKMGWTLNTLRAYIQRYNKKYKIKYRVHGTSYRFPKKYSDKLIAKYKENVKKYEDDPITNYLIKINEKK